MPQVMSLAQKTWEAAANANATDRARRGLPPTPESWETIPPEIRQYYEGLAIGQLKGEGLLPRIG
jgi:hypothetical protein